MYKNNERFQNHGDDNPSQNEFLLYHQRIQFYAHERQIDVNAALYLQEVKAARAVELEKIRLDIREKKGILADEIVIDAAGNLTRRKEFLSVLPQKFAICNFYLPTPPVLYGNIENPGEKVLFFTAGKEDGHSCSVYINLKMADLNYLRRQFRNSGLKLKVRANQIADFIPLLLEALLERAVPTTLTTKRGFYVDVDETVKYAGRDALIWEEVAKRAR